MMTNSIYTNTARFDNQARALTETELRRLAPSVFAVHAHESRSERFQPIPTIEIIRGLQAEGFSVVGARQSNTRDESKKDFTKHMLRIRRLDDGKTYNVGDTVFEMILKNANDGTAAYDLMAGLWRIRCSNSLVTQLSTLDSVKVRHTGTANAIQGKVIEGTYSVLQNAEHALAAPADWGSVNLNRDERMILANAAHMVRFGDATEDDAPLAAKAIKPEQFLIPARFEDKGNDLWTTFNVVQERTIKGGMTNWTRDANNRQRQTTARGVKGIDQDVKLNKALWMIGQEMARLKGVQSAQQPVAA